MIDCFCIRNNYNFDLEVIDRSIILYQDLSDWMEEYGLPETYDVSITTSTGVSKTITLSVQSKNKLTDQDLGFNYGFQDGIYCFTIISCGKTYMRSRAIIPALECCLKSAYVTLPDSDFTKLEKISHFIESAKNHAELNNYKNAKDSFRIARELLDKLKCDCNC